MLRKLYILPLLLLCAWVVEASAPSDQVMYFSGNGDRVQIPTPLDNNTSTFTMETWIKSDSNEKCQAGRYNRIFSSQSNRFEVAECGGEIRVYAGGRWRNTVSDIRDGQWHHLVVVKDTAETIVYVDGIIVRRYDFVATIPFTDNFVVGGYNSGGQESFQGYLDEVRLWSTARDSVEVCRNMFRTMPTTEPGLLVYYQFDTEDPGGVTNSVDGAGMGSMMAGSGNIMPEYQTSDRNIRRSLYLNGNDVLIEPVLSGNSDYTIEFSFKMNEETRAGYARFFGMDNYHLDIAQLNDGSLHFYTGTWRPLGASVTDTKWHHFAMTRSGNEHKAYLDGQEIYSFTFASSSYNFTGKQIYLGGKHNNGSERWQGWMDEVRIWDVARSQIDIAENICSGVNPNEADLVAYYSMDQIGKSYVIDLTENKRDGLRRGAYTDPTVFPQFSWDAARPEATFIVESAACQGMPTNFIHLSSDATATWAWDLDGDKTIDGSSTGSFSHVFNDLGSQTIALNITSNLGCTDWYTVDFEVFEVPQAAISADTETCIGTPVSFTNSSSGPSGVEWTWDYNNDGFSDYSGNDDDDFQFNFPTTGTFDGQFIINNKGCSDTASIQISAYDVPNVSFQADDVCFGTTTNFFSNTTIYTDLASFYWDLQNDGQYDVEDENTNTPLNPQFTYDAPGTYTVTLVVENTCGQTTYTDTMVQVFAAVVPTVENTGGQLSSSIANSYQWYFNDEAIDGATDQTFAPSESGTYYVCTEDSNGCSACSEPVTVTTTSVDDHHSLTGLRIFPNPTTNYLQITLNQQPIANGTQANVYDMLGRKVSETILFGNQLPVADLVNGVYLIQLTDGESTYTAKFQKN